MRKLIHVIVALGLVLAACGCARPASAGSLTVLVSWGGAELSAFKYIVDEFESNSGINVHVTSTRALTQELDADQAIGTFPDLAALPSIGAISQFKSNLKQLNDLIDIKNYNPPWRNLMLPVPGSNAVYAVPVKIDVKSLIWYDPAMFPVDGRGVPGTWPRLLSFGNSVESAGGSPWCLAVSSTPTSGWPGTDWISDIMLSKYGPGIYQDWVSGNLSWTSSQVEQAWETWGQLIAGPHAVYNGLDAALLTNIGSGAPYPQPDGCYLQHGTLVDEGYPPPSANEPVEDGPSSLGFGTAYDFFQFPSPGSADSPIQVSADFMGMFNATPQAMKFVKFMTKTTEQERWVKQHGLDGFSADKQVKFTAYPDPVLRMLAKLLTSGRELCFGASDAMSQELSTAFDHAVLAYLADPRKTVLTHTILPDLDKLKSTGSQPKVCGQP